MGSSSSSSVQGFLVLLLTVLNCCSSLQASAHRIFNVGGKDGWVVNPSEHYAHWAQRNRFQVNDILHFRYKRGTDSVLVVKKEDYDSCNTKSPLHRFRGGGSTIQLNKSGPFFFISGHEENCKQGQKLIVDVMAVSHNRHQPSSPSTSPSSVSPQTQSPSKAPIASPPSQPTALAMPPMAGMNAPAPAPAPKSSASKSSLGVALGISFVAVVFFSSFA